MDFDVTEYLQYEKVLFSVSRTQVWPGFLLQGCTYRCGVILRFGVLKRVQSRGVKAPPDKFFLSFQSGNGIVYLVQKACKGEMLSSQTELICFLQTLQPFG